MMRVLLTGAGGQLGQEIIHIVSQRNDTVLYPLAHRELDVTDRDAVMEKVLSFTPDVILHAAAYTHVDNAEMDETTTYAVNADGSKHIAEAAVACGAKLCFISTDYVFDGELGRPYREDDPTCPLGIYGKSKERGERYVQRICPRSFVVRTSWLYGAHGSNFVRTMLRVGPNAGLEGLRVVNDQTGCPTWTRDLVVFLFQLIESDAYGIYHGSNTGAATWYEFAKAIFSYSGIDVPVTPVRSSEFPRPAKRPRYSVLAPVLLKERGFEPLRPWREALQAYFQTHGGLRREVN
jgi:dTDP-4-dehydrorhamnose reductase